MLSKLMVFLHLEFPNNLNLLITTSIHMLFFLPTQMCRCLYCQNSFGMNAINTPTKGNGQEKTEEVYALNSTFS